MNLHKRLLSEDECFRVLISLRFRHPYRTTEERLIGDRLMSVFTQLSELLSDDPYEDLLFQTILNIAVLYKYPQKFSWLTEPILEALRILEEYKDG